MQVEAALERWELRSDPVAVRRSSDLGVLVAVLRPDGTPAVLSLIRPHGPAMHAHLALRRWGGRGGARLLAADPASWTLLLEPLDLRQDLATRWADSPEQACSTIGTLLSRLSVPALPQLERLSVSVARFLDRSAHAPPAIPRRFLEQARSIATDLISDDSVDACLVSAALHPGVVRARRSEDGHATDAADASSDGWVAAEVRPVAGDPAYAVCPALWHGWEHRAAAADPRWDLRLQLGWICDAAGIDEERARQWALVRTVAAALDATAIRSKTDTPSSAAPDLTAWVTLLKALQPT